MAPVASRLRLVEAAAWPSPSGPESPGAHIIAQSPVASGEVLHGRNAKARDQGEP